LGSKDFHQVFTEGFTDPVSGMVTLQQSNLQILHGLVGPTLGTGYGPIRASVTVQDGFVNFRFDRRPATFDTGTSSVPDSKERRLRKASDLRSSPPRRRLG
jgi:hypothetical protein